jgi:antitoxin component of RelBE/YafQ-DinJ toxin-antitoxin module
VPVRLAAVLPGGVATLFLAQVKLRKGLPFPLRVPNKETRRAIKEARARKNVETFDSVSAWAKKTRSL